jgi:DNA mismatch repair protein MutS
MAGVPADVVERASELLETRPSEPDAARTLTTSVASTDGGREAILAELAAVDLAETTPIEALNLLSRLQSELD